MTQTLRFSTELIRDAQRHAALNFRTVPKQIEYWYRLGKTAEENPDLPLNFIKGVLAGKEELERGEVSAFEFRTPEHPWMEILQTNRFKKAYGKLHPISTGIWDSVPLGPMKPVKQDFFTAKVAVWEAR